MDASALAAVATAVPDDERAELLTVSDGVDVYAVTTATDVCLLRIDRPAACAAFTDFNQGGVEVSSLHLLPDNEVGPDGSEQIAHNLWR